MKKIYASILLVLFTGFLISLSLNFNTYLRIINAGADTEDVTTMPEEHNEDIAHSKVKDPFQTSNDISLLLPDSAEEGYVDHTFMLAESIYYDVPHSPPDLG